MIRCEKINNCDLYFGDSIEIMESLKESADVLVCDPPYKIESGGNTTSEMGGCFSRDRYDNSGSIVDCDVDWPDFMPLFFEVLRGDAHAYIMANNRHVENMLNSAREANFRFHNILAWDKITATPNKFYMKNLEFLGFFFKGKAKNINDCGSKQLVRVPQRDETDHPTEKPVGLMEYYIRNSSVEGETVIDPFMGSGTTGVAAVRSGRKFIGIEKNEKWFDVACKRIEKAEKVNCLFY